MSFTWKTACELCWIMGNGYCRKQCAAPFLAFEAKASVYLAPEQSNGHGARIFRFFYNP